ncbi:hypothetical protein V8C86DRAFT_2735107 [Haematococcus lacustris]
MATLHFSRCHASSSSWHLCGSRRHSQHSFRLSLCAPSLSCQSPFLRNTHGLQTLVHPTTRLSAARGPPRTIPKEVQQAVPKEKEYEEEKREEKEEGEEEGVIAGQSRSAALPLPEVRYQRYLGVKERKLLQREANEIAKNKELINMRIGKHGLTQTVISSAMDVLMKHPYLRVRLADDCGLERREGVLKLEKLLDALCVQQVGHTITLYRQPGLPRPSNCPSCVVLGSQAKVTKAAKLADAKAKRMAAKKPPGTDEVHRDRPPELQVLS